MDAIELGSRLSPVILKCKYSLYTNLNFQIFQMSPVGEEDHGEGLVETDPLPWCILATKPGQRTWDCGRQEGEENTGLSKREGGAGVGLLLLCNQINHVYMSKFNKTSRNKKSVSHYENHWKHAMKLLVNIIQWEAWEKTHGEWTSDTQTRRQTNRHVDSMNDPAQRAESVKMWILDSEIICLHSAACCTHNALTIDL